MAQHWLSVPLTIQTAPLRSVPGMASKVDRSVRSLRQVEGGARDDGALTWDEAAALTENMKAVVTPKPSITRRPPGDLKVADLPLRFLGEGKENQWVGLFTDREGDIAFDRLEELFLQQRYSDMPEPIKIKGDCKYPYTVQVVILQPGRWVLKHFKLEADSKIHGFRAKERCQGVAREID